MGKLDGKVALVTGAGRMRGIGRSAALAFAREGADVTVTGRDPDTFPHDEKAAGWQDIDGVAAEIVAMGRSALPLVVDVTKEAQVQEAVERTVARFGRIDFLVNNASAPRMAAWAPLDELTEDAWHHVMDIKVTGAFLCTKAVVQALLRQAQGGSIVNVISVEAKISRANDLAYATASGALATFTHKAGKALVLQRRFLKLVSFGAEIASRNARPQSCQPTRLTAMKRCSRPLFGNPSYSATSEKSR